MHAQAVSNAAVKTDVAGLALSHGPGRQADSHLAAIGSPRRKAGRPCLPRAAGRTRLRDRARHAPACQTPPRWPAADYRFPLRAPTPRICIGRRPRPHRGGRPRCHASPLRHAGLGLRSIIRACAVLPAASSSEVSINLRGNHDRSLHGMYSRQTKHGALLIGANAHKGS
jgi:hypothetical protein